MNLNDLDNPVWHAINSHHLPLSIQGDIAARYQSDIFQAAAMPKNTKSALNDLKSLVEADEIIFIVGTHPNNLDGWQVLDHWKAPQMVCTDLNPDVLIESTRLNL